MKMHYIYFILNYDEIQASGISSSHLLLSDSSHLLFVAQAPPTCCYRAPPTCCSWRRLLPLAVVDASSSHLLFLVQAPPTCCCWRRLLPLAVVGASSSHLLFLAQAPPTCRSPGCSDTYLLYICLSLCAHTVF